MKLIDLLNRLGLASRVREAEALFDGLPADAPEDWRALAVGLTLRFDDRRVALGVGGGQGAGKTTLSTLLAAALEANGRHAACLSLDDFYLTRAEREQLALEVHPLLRTRGVPGSHDVGLACSVLTALKAGEACRVPRFDKAMDDRMPAADDRQIPAGCEVVIFEGWCVGAPAQPETALATPCNDLERNEDPTGEWRRFVNGRLEGDYKALWRLLDERLFLAVPDLAAVIRWRTEQEQQHPPENRMDSADLARFVAHYERLTLWMNRVLPERAELVAFLDGNHRLSDLQVFRSRSATSG